MTLQKLKNKNVLCKYKWRYEVYGYMVLGCIAMHISRVGIGANVNKILKEKVVKI